ncbi:MAG: PAS domain S-box protein [Cytophagales bacterium]|nr:PAS domain S-box protein [Cytophagales bacterium]
MVGIWVEDHLKWVSANTRAVRNAKNKLQYVLLTLVDVDHAIKTLEQLKENEAKYRSLFQVTNDTILVVRDLRVIDSNPRAHQLFGRPAEELAGRSIKQLMASPQDEDQHKTMRYFNEALTGRAQFFETSIWNKRKQVRHVEVHANRFTLQGEYCLLLVLRDTTDAHENQKRLEDSQTKYLRMINSSPDIISVVDEATGELLEVNETFAQWSGYPREKMLGRTTEELQLWPNLQDRTAFYRLYQEGQGQASLVAPFVNVMGETRHFQHRARRIQLNGRNCLLVMARDVEDQLLAQRKLQESKERFTTLFENYPVSVVLIHEERHIIMEANRAFYELSGFQTDEVINQGARGLVPWVDPAQRLKFLKNTASMGRSLW